MNINELMEQIYPQIVQPLWENWYIKEKIGSGGFSVVYRVEAQRMKRTDVAALKIQPVIAEFRGTIDDERYQSTLIRRKQEMENESAIMYQLKDCKNIVTYEEEDIREFSLNGKLGGYLFLIRMEYLQNIQDLLYNGNFDCSEANVRKLALDIVTGLKDAHDHGIIHRDIKPANFFVSKDGTYKLGDFNIAKQSDSARTFAGTNGYISPEVYLARTSLEEVYHAQADIYSMGICLYQMMNDGLFPFEDQCEQEEAFKRRMIGERFPLPKHASNAFGELILKACAFDPNQRFHSCAELLSDLQQLPPIYEDSEKQNRDAYATVYAGSSSQNPNPDLYATQLASAKSPVSNQTVLANSPKVQSAALSSFSKRKWIFAALCLCSAAVFGILLYSAIKSKDDFNATASLPEESTNSATSVTSMDISTQYVTSVSTNTIPIQSTLSGNETAEDVTAVIQTVLPNNPAHSSVSPTEDSNSNDREPRVVYRQENAPKDVQEPQQPDKGDEIQPIQTSPPIIEDQQPQTTYEFRYSVQGDTIQIDGFNTYTQDVVIPPEIEGKRVSAIGDYAFSGLDITSVSLPDGIQRIGSNAFSECAWLSSFDMPDSIEYVGSYAFANSAIEYMRISNGMTVIAESAFYGIPYIQEIVIPDSVIQISDYAFEQCESLMRIWIPSSVQVIGTRAFYCSPPVGCEVYYASSSLSWDRMDISSSAFDNEEIYYNSPY